MRTLLIIFIFCSYTCHAQQSDSVENIVFEGAGIRGIAYSGAINELEQKGILKNIKRVGGTSAGAITALLLTLGYSSGEIANIVSSTSFKKFNDGRFFFLGGFHRLRKYYGWYRGKRFERWLTELIGSKTGNRDISFAELHLQGTKDLFVTGTSLNKQKLIVFSYENYPQMKVKDAVRISMSIPLYFEAVFIDSTGKVVPHPRRKTGLDIMLDGGFIANFPISIFDSSKYVKSSATNEFRVNNKTIGFRIDSDAQIENDTGNNGLASMQVTNFTEYLTAFYTLILENLNRQTLTGEDWKRTVSISDGAIGPRIRKLKKGEVNILVQNGKASTEKYFK
jgi:NTE family protein